MTNKYQEQITRIKTSIFPPVWNYFLDIVNDEDVLGEFWEDYITNIYFDTEESGRKGYGIEFDETLFWFYENEINVMPDGVLENLKPEYPAVKVWEETEKGKFKLKEFENWKDGEIFSWKPEKRLTLPQK